MDLKWRKSSRSGTGNGNCVEVATNVAGMVAVRDSKNPDGPMLTASPAEWRAFLSTVRQA
ncbi:DUF397 domain-containing protein [Micromonospora sp. Llam7]|uniref:DUF397 domain-containing protein n=1 Tax=Micromonospora tarapacensis TaxID=2835305 RepID=UPI001C833383|nr:DUF397 domain-containing protein [Micromonospora tarapacensis]MBX7266508.1 DUF397 domain-containing protein [Micromonospora tarapacensis]